MPIKPENKQRYPRNWWSIRAAILDRSNGFCEGSPLYPDCRAQHGARHPITGSKVILTVAHMDQTPENCTPENLRALCQRCHLTFDARWRRTQRPPEAHPSRRLTNFNGNAYSTNISSIVDRQSSQPTRPQAQKIYPSRTAALHGRCPRGMYVFLSTING